MPPRDASSTPQRATLDSLAVALVEATPDALVVVDAEGRIVVANRRTEEMFGYPRDELVGQLVEVLVPEALRGGHRAQRAEFARAVHARPMAAVLLARRRDGTTLPVEISLAPLRSEGADLVAAFVRDATDRRRAEASLREAEARAVELIERAPDAVFVADLDGRYIDVNVVACRMLGYSRDELLGRRIVDLVPPEDVARLSADKAYLSNGERVQVSEWVLRRKDGSGVPVEVSATIHQDGRWVAFVRDISERKRTEEAIRRGEEALARAQLGSWEWDLETKRVTRSSQLLAIFGASPEAGNAAPFSMMHHVHPADRDHLMAAVEEAAREGQPYRVEHRIVRADGVERIVLHQGEAILENGRPVRILGTLLDVTERRRAEAKREEALGWLHGVFDHAPVGLVLFHKDGRVETNAYATALLGPGNDPRTTQALDLSGAPIPFDRLPGQRALGGERVGPIECLQRTARGVHIPISVAAQPVVDAYGDVKGAVLAFQDISATRELERLRAEWSSVVAHDLVQPLNGIMLTATILESSAADAEARAGLARIRGACRRMSRMIADLMDLSRLEAHRLELVRRPTAIPPLVRDCIARLALVDSARSADGGRRLVGDSSPVELIVRGDPKDADADADRIAQVLDNLLSNAVKYGEPGGPITVIVEGESDHVSVSVVNHGPGILPAELPHLFGRFQRTKQARESRLKGTGLGLYITRALVETHGGRITVESTPGETTTFRFTLPVA